LPGSRNDRDVVSLDNWHEADGSPALPRDPAKAT
jgi:hypothetical protein